MATIAVTTLLDENDAGATVARPLGAGLSLREAIALANSQAGADTITFDASRGAGGTIRLASTLLASDALTIDGDIDNDGTADILITGDAGNNDTIGSTGITDIAASQTAGTLGDNVQILVAGGNLMLEGLVLTGGVGGRGGAVNGITVTVTLTNSTVSGNSAGAGGGIRASTATLINTTVSGNRADLDGGGIYVTNTATLTNTTISGNSAGSGGGGIFTGGANLTNTTVSGNSAARNGGGIDAGEANLTNSIVLGNDAAISSDEIAAAVTLTGGNIVGTDVFQGNTDVGDTTAAEVFAATVDIGGGVLAGVLADNGGPVETIALKASASNPALDSSNASAPATDAAGNARVDLPGIANANGFPADLGAYEVQTVVNTAPVAVADALTVAEGGTATALTGGATSVLANDADPDSAVVTAVLVSGPAYGSLTLNANGTFSYTHDGSEILTDSFSYKVNDGTLDSAPVTVSITIDPVNDAPEAQNGSVSGNAGALISGAVLATDRDNDPLTYALFGANGGALNGTVALNADGSFTYTPAANFSGSDSFQFVANDGSVDSAPAKIQLTVSPAAPSIPTFTGTPGDDSFTAPSGDSRFDALGAIDTITFDFKLTEAKVSYSGNQVIVDGPGGSHTVLTGFEIYKFTDGMVNNNDGNWLVDDLFYYSRNHDVWNAHVEAETHYDTFGWHERRDPSAFFDTVIYLSANPDVRSAGVNPLDHWHNNGWLEGRVPSITFDPQQYLKANPDVMAAHIDPLEHFRLFGAEEGRQPFAPAELLQTNGFDYVFYLQNNPDVDAANVDPFFHFQTVGWKEGRNPNALFDTEGYLAAYADVKAAGVNPLDHYNTFGWKEGRDPSTAFDTTEYLGNYADVQAAQVNPLLHYLHFGINEGRSPQADGVWG